jgi:hypothetical protein
LFDRLVRSNNKFGGIEPSRRVLRDYDCLRDTAMAWNNSWYLVPHESVDTVVHPLPYTDPQDMWPHVAYADGGIEGLHFQALWDQFQGVPSGAGRPMCEVILYIEQRSSGPIRTVGCVSSDYVAALAALKDDDAAALASSSWQETFIYPWATSDVLVATIDAWRALARRAVAEDKAIVMEWYC